MDYILKIQSQMSKFQKYLMILKISAKGNLTSKWSMDKSNDGIFKNLLRVLLYQLIKEGIVRTVDKDQDEVYCHSENKNTFRGEHINCRVRTSCQKCNSTSKFTKNCRSADPYKQQIVQKGHYRTLKFD